MGRIIEEILGGITEENQGIFFEENLGETSLWEEYLAESWKKISKKVISGEVPEQTLRGVTEKSRKEFIEVFLE